MKFKICILAAMTWITLSGCSTIRVVPHQETGTESSSVEVGKNYTIETNSSLVLFYKGDFLKLIRSNKTYKPEVDTIFNNQYPPMACESRWQIVGTTDEGNYVVFPIDGYRRKVLAPADNSPGFMSAMLGAAAQAAGGKLMDNLSSKANGAARSTSQGVGSGLSNDMTNKVNSAAVSTAGGNKYLAAANGMSNSPGIINTVAKVGSNVGSGSGARSTSNNGLISSLDVLYRTQDAIFFFNKDTLKPYAVRPYVERTVMDKLFNHIYFKILDSNGDFRLTKQYFAYNKDIIEYQGIKDNTASFLFKGYVGDDKQISAFEIIELDLSKSNSIETHGFKINVLSANKDRADLRIMGMQL